ncbi:MAG: carbon starvation protein A [Candidatus Omnitrophota bacterium]
MNSIWILAAAILGMAVAYRFYGRYLSRLFGVDENRKTPAHEQSDGVDFVPAKNWMVLFGHHFSAIAGAGPVIGPVLACAYWGWGPALLWVLFGSAFLGGVHDFSTLIVSIRSRGNSVGEIACAEISKRARLLFLIFIWLALILIVAVFSLFTAQTFIAEPDAVLPSYGLIPVAMLVGWLAYRREWNMNLVTGLGVGLLVFLLWLGTKVPVKLGMVAGLEPLTVWILSLLVYCFFASVLPVQLLLQPRDYIASYLLFAAVALGTAGVLITHPDFTSPFARAFAPADWKDAGWLWPMLFVTVACGAISGFHSLVSSGTSSKQIPSEKYALRITYGGMLLEGFVAVLVIIAVAAGLSHAELSGTLRAAGPIQVFGRGFGAITRPIFGDYGGPFAVLVLNAFVLTTLDASTRIGRYLTSELFGIKNKYVSTLIVITVSAALALTGQWNRIWPAFGAANQLIAGLALLVTSCWLLHRGRSFWATLIPAVLMLLTTIAAFVFQCVSALHRRSGGRPDPDYLIAGIAIVMIAVSAVIAFEAFSVLRSRKPA